jgi:hypothetical protein
LTNCCSFDQHIGRLPFKNLADGIKDGLVKAGVLE